MVRSSRVGLTLLVALMGIALPATMATGYYSYSWFTTLSAPVPYGNFEPVSTSNAALKEVFIANGAIQTTETNYYDPNSNATAASVGNQIISFNPFAVSNSSTGDYVVYFLKDAALVRNYFGSSFIGTGTAEDSDGGGEPLIPVTYRGSIVYKHGTYYLKVSVSGFGTESDSGGINYEFVRVCLNSSSFTPAP